jgi:hypothetical protein
VPVWAEAVRKERLITRNKRAIETLLNALKELFTTTFLQWES